MCLVMQIELKLVVNANLIKLATCALSPDPNTLLRPSLTTPPSAPLQLVDVRQRYEA